MIPDLKLHGIVGTAARQARRLPIVPVLLLAGWLGACDKVPLLAPSGTTIRLYTNAQVLPLNGSAQITASVQETGGWPVQNGTVVTFTTSLGSVTPNEATTTDGKVTVIFNAGSTSGTAVINAFSGSSSTTGGSTTTGGTGGTPTGSTGATGSGVTIVVGAAAVNSVVLTASPSSVSALGGTSTITAMVLDANNNAVSGVPVQFTTDQGTLAPVSVNTNANGNASTTLTTNQTATVTVTAGSKTATAKVTAVAVPTVSITGPSTTPTAGLTTTFTVNVAAGSGAAPIRNVQVDFGDGTVANLGAATGALSVPHVYLKPNDSTNPSYTVTATVTDASGQSTTTSIPVVVFAAVPFTVTVTAPSGKSGVSLTISAAPGAGAPVIKQYVWNFGDGSTATTEGPTVPHTYELKAGTTVPQQFIVSVTAVGEDGRTGFGSAATTIAP